MLALTGSRITGVRWRAWQRTLALLAVGLLGYVAVAWPLNRLARGFAGEPRTAIISHKLDFLRTHARDYDVVLVGSSRIHYDVEPATLDDGLRAAGCPVRTYNFGVPGLTAAEQDWLTGKLAEVPDRRWRAVLIERPQLPLRTLRYLGSDRHRLGHVEPHQLWLSYQSLATSSRSRLNWGVDMVHEVLGYLYYQLGPGELGRLVAEPAADVPSDGFTIDLSRGGFVPLEEEVSPLLKARADRMDWDEFARRLVELRSDPPVAAPLPELRLDQMREQIEQARRLAPTVVIALLPQAIRSVVDENASIVEAGKAGAFGDTPILNMGDPQAHPRLFADGIWFDDDHLMGDGPSRLGQDLGRALCQRVPALRAAAP
ncbi:MAG TPA: hypothetical protein PKA13_14280 [Geminicoccaceae bacterium]|nr:hypothetical protein [Geminicoccus sp.]HMU50937.1 hypothetical protein [Geminicoccaceae bacterium]